MVPSVTKWNLKEKERSAEFIDCLKALISYDCITFYSL